ncbi:expressed unknown protein [Seminavis robusta]|uniref:Uncharacterized protein n=1 Tax=Seminavis robusta TaxID=568900 RepID=A0A9N8EB32_9STRA|nr:expressed unknown protein [Seminavis robusta]|eukprot:Sro749_g196810.1 n/a (452) ;mRNA; f:25530-26885
MATSFIAGKSIVSSSAVAVAAASPSFLVPTPAFSSDQYWPLGKIAFSLLPLAGGTRRATVEQCIVPNTMWTFDQIQGIVNVNVPVRSTVIALQQGGLWIHNPVAPTQEFLTRIQELQQQYGPVKHIVLGTVALEHKATLGAFARNFPEAIVWVQPGQWSFPLPFPLELLGVSQRKNKGTLRELVPQEQYTTNPPEWINEIDYEILGPLKFQSVGAFSETAFFHKPTQSLLVTDVVISVTEEPPAIIQEDPRALLFHSRDSAGDDTLLQTGDTPQLRRKGWRRMVQFGLIFFPSQINVPSLRQDIRDEQIVPPPLRNLGQAAVPFNLYPWTWNDDNDVDNFRAISNNGAMFCPPILTKLILDREPQRTLAWVDRVCERFRDMKRVVPCHLNNDIQVTSAKEFSQAFNSLRCSSSTTITGRGPLREDLRLLQNASDLLTQLQVVAPTQVECRQ